MNTVLFIIKVSINKYVSNINALIHFHNKNPSSSLPIAPGFSFVPVKQKFLAGLTSPKWSMQ